MTGLLGSIVTNRELIYELSRRELMQSHASHFLGGVWAFMNPLLLLLIYFLVFHYVFPLRMPDDMPSRSQLFLLAGLIQWVVMAELIVRSCTIIRANQNLVKQINFPMETLVIKTVAATLFVQVVMSAGLGVILFFQSELPSMWVLPLWLGAILLQALFMLGLAFILASLTPFMPDVSEFAGVVARLGLFITPILYTADQFGPTMEALFYVNPFTYFTLMHQDAFFWQAPVHLWQWGAGAALSFAILWLGYSLFRQMSPAFTDVI